MLKNVKYILLAASLVLPITGLHGEDFSVLKKFSDTISGLRSYTADIKQTVSGSDGGREEFEGRITVSSGGCMNILYEKPAVQRVVCDGHALYWYFPESGDLFLYSGAAAEKTGLLKGNGTSLPGRGFLNIMDYRYEGMTFYGLFNRAHVFSVTNRKEGNRILVWFDYSGSKPVRKIIHDKNGREIIRETYDRYSLVKGIPLPGRIILYARGKGGIVKTVTEYTNYRVNISPSDELFKFRILRTMKVKKIGY